MRFIIVARDIGSANVTSAVARSLRNEGHQVFAVTEGKATEVFQERGIFPYVQVPEGTDLALIDFRKMFVELDPDWVVTGLSSPMNLEHQAGQSANDCNVPLAIIEDVPGASRRMDARVALVVTPDEMGLRLCQGLHPKAVVLIAGNIGVQNVQLGCATEINVPQDLSTIHTAKQENLAKLMPFDPEKVRDVLEKLHRK